MVKRTTYRKPGQGKKPRRVAHLLGAGEYKVTAARRGLRDGQVNGDYDPFGPEKTSKQPTLTRWASSKLGPLTVIEDVVEEGAKAAVAGTASLDNGKSDELESRRCPACWSFNYETTSEGRFCSDCAVCLSPLASAPSNVPSIVTVKKESEEEKADDLDDTPVGTAPASVPWGKQKASAGSASGDADDADDTETRMDEEEDFDAGGDIPEEDGGFIPCRDLALLLFGKPADNYGIAQFKASVNKNGENVPPLVWKRCAVFVKQFAIKGIMSLEKIRISTWYSRLACLPTQGR